MHFFKTLLNCDNQSFQEYFTEKVCFHESLFTYNGKALGAESSARGYFVEKKNSFFQKGFWRNKSYWRTIFQEAAPGTLAKCKMRHIPTRLDSLWTLATVAKRSILHMAGVLKQRLVTKANGDRY